MNMKVTVKKWSILTLCFTMAFTCIPLFESAVFAADDEIGEKVVELSEDEVKANREKAVAELDAKFGVDGVQEEIEKELPVLNEKTMNVPVKQNGLKQREDNAKKLNGFTLSDDGESVLTVTEQDSEGYVYISSSIDLTDTPYYYLNIYVDDTDYPAASLNRKTLYGFALDLSQYSVGYHTIYVSVDVGKGEEIYDDCIAPNVRSEILLKPSNKTSYYNTGITSISAYYGGDNYYDGEYLDAYVQYKKGKNGTWSDTIYGPLYTYSTYQKIPKKLRPNTTYYVRIVLVKEVYNELTGRNDLFKSYSKAVKLLTAYKKPKVKKIDISKVKQYCHKYRVQYAWRIWYNRRTGVIVRRKALYHTYRYWYTRFKVTTKFSKKQGVAGIRIDTIHGLGVWKGGNKKKYSQTFTCRGKKKGKKITIRIKSCRSKKYGGWSKTYKKKVRCR